MRKASSSKRTANVVSAVLSGAVWLLMSVSATAGMDACGDGGGGSQDIESLVASFDEPGVTGGSLQFELTPEVFEKEIAPARTFCLLSEVEALKEAGLGKGATRENTLVLGDPESEPRLPDEAIRHKMLDAVGDLALSGYTIDGHLIVHKGGHELHRQLVAALLARPDAWTLVGSEDKGFVRQAGRAVAAVAGVTAVHA